MPKLKTHRGAAKRFRLTATGKIKRSKAFGRHILTKKSAKRMRGLKKATYVVKEEYHKVREYFPYSK